MNNFNKIANFVVANQEFELDDLTAKHGVDFQPKYQGVSFIITNDGVYRRGPYQASYFVKISLYPHYIGELKLQGQDDIIALFMAHLKQPEILKQKLIATKKFHVKKLT